MQPLWGKSSWARSWTCSTMFAFIFFFMSVCLKHCVILPYNRGGQLSDWLFRKCSHWAWVPLNWLSPQVCCGCGKDALITVLTVTEDELRRAIKKKGKKSDKIDLFYLSFFFYSQFRQKKNKQARKGTNSGILSVLTAVILVFLQPFSQSLIAKW